MYNGIGLTTARGSATSGHVQKNLSHIKPEFFRNKLQRNKESFGDSSAHGQSSKDRSYNKQVIEHKRKFAIESKVLELEISLKDRGKSEEEIKQRSDELRERLSKEGSSVAVYSSSSRDSHEVSARKDEENRRLRDALNVRSSKYGDETATKKREVGDREHSEDRGYKKSRFEGSDRNKRSRRSSS